MMSVSRKIAFLLFLFPSGILLEVSLKTSDKYGPYSMKYTSFELCSGPRRYNASKLEAALVDEGNVTVVLLNTTYMENYKIHEVRLIVYAIKGASRTTLWEHRWRDPCGYYALSNLLQQYGVKNCVIPKGSLRLKINLMKVTEAFIGNSFFYGEFKVKALAISKKLNLYCSVTGILFEKKV